MEATEGVQYKNVVAIDAGYRNLAVCNVDNTDWQQPAHWVAEDLWKPRKGRRSVPTNNDCVEQATYWVRANKKMLDEADAIVLENQMRDRFIIINTVIQSHYLEKTFVVHPMTVAAFWKLPKTRELKKEAAIEVVKRNGVEITRKGGAKLDDLADAWLMAVYWMIELGAVRIAQVVV